MTKPEVLCTENSTPRPGFEPGIPYGNSLSRRAQYQVMRSRHAVPRSRPKIFGFRGCDRGNTNITKRTDLKMLSN